MFLQRRCTNGRQAHEKMLNVTHQAKTTLDTSSLPSGQPLPSKPRKQVLVKTGRTGTLRTAGGSVSWCGHGGPQRLKREGPRGPAIPRLVRAQGERAGSPGGPRTPMFTAHPSRQPAGGAPRGSTSGRGEQNAVRPHKGMLFSLKMKLI